MCVLNDGNVYLNVGEAAQVGLGRTAHSSVVQHRVEGGQIVARDGGVGQGGILGTCGKGPTCVWLVQKCTIKIKVGIQLVQYR